LEEAQTGTGDVTDWLEWFLGCLSRAIEGSERSLDAAVEKARFFENWKSVPMNERQLRMVNMLLDGFEGKLRTSKWAKITKCSQDTALRDIDDLVQKSILTKEGDGRSTSYSLIRKQDDLE
jgi:Fic family protein